MRENEYWDEWYSDYIRPDEDANEPMSDLNYPVVNSLDSVDTINHDFDPEKYEVVGTVATNFYWRELIKKILPLGHVGLIVVFHNPCNPSFTYQIK